MRTLRLLMAGVVILALLGGLSVTVLAQEEAEWAAVSGTSGCGLETAGVETDGPPFSLTDQVLRFTDVSTDPRVSGPSTVVISVEGWDLREGNNAVAWVDNTIEGPEGTWVGHSYGLDDDEGVLHLVGFLVGNGAYEGLTFTLAGTVPAGTASLAYDGLIQPGSPPPGFPVAPFPEPAGAPAEEPTEPTAAETIGEPADSGARIIEIEELDERTVDLTIDSPAVGTEKVRLLLPDGFDPDGDDAWPVLYLLHGAFDDYTSWTRETDVEELTADLPLLVVMAEAGEDGWYSDWWNGGEGGPPMWETFHLTEVRELLERNWQAGDERVVAGVSMGGLGAMSYAARHPGLFEAAAAFSGVLHPTTLAFDLHPGLWGSRTEQADVWAAHDPVLLADALEGMPLYVSYGNGEPGPLDPEVAAIPDDAPIDDPEPWIAEMNEAFVARLAELGIPAVVDAYGLGTHTWPYFERGLHEAMPLLLEALGM